MSRPSPQLVEVPAPDGPESDAPRPGRSSDGSPEAPSEAPVQRTPQPRDERTAEQVVADAPIVRVARTDRAVRTSLIGLFVIGVFVALYLARALLIPFTLAVLLFLTFRPVVRWGARHRIPAGATAATIVLGLVIAIATVFYSLSGPVTDAANNAPEIARQVDERIQGLRERFSTMAEAARRIQPDEGEVAGDAPDAVAEPGEQVRVRSQDSDGNVDEVVVRTEGGSSPFAMVQSIAVNVAGILTTLLIMLVLLFFLLASGSLFYEKLVQSFDRLEDKKQALFAVHEVERDISRYLLTITIINWGLGASIGLAMWALGMPNPLLWVIVGAVFNYVPYAGAIAGTLSAFVVALLTFDTVGQALLVPVAYYTLTTIEGSFVTPYFVGRRLAINTVSVFLFVAVWAWLWGMWGALMAVPVLVVLKEVCENVPGGQKVANFLSVRPEHRDESKPEEPGQGRNAPVGGAPVAGVPPNPGAAG